MLIKRTVKPYNKPELCRHIVIMSEHYILVDGLLMYKCAVTEAITKRLKYKLGIMDASILGWI